MIKPRKLPRWRSARIPASLSAFVLTILLAFSLSSLHAQDVNAEKKIAATLPEASQTVLTKLGSFNQLPEGTWHLHAGDLAHGEAVALDDTGSGWSTIAREGKAPKEAVWFRQTVTIPPTLNGYDLTGSRIWFQFHVDGNGPMPQIIYFNGRRVAMGEDLEPITLLDDVKPGEKVVIAVKVLQTVDTKTFYGASTRIDFPESRPNPAALQTEFLSAALLVPSFAPGDAGKMTTLNAAIAAVDVKALDQQGPDTQKKFDASLTAAQQKLESLRPLLQQATFHLTGNSHIDAAWLWPWTETVDVVKRTFGTALQLMNEYPTYTYTQSAAAYNEWMSEKYPEMNDEIKKRIQQGSWEIVGGMWVEPDLNMPDGESLVRQLLVGKRWYKQHYGVDVRIGWNPDSFGYNWQLPQIYKKSGVDYFVTQKMTWNDTNQLPFKLFWWESPDGSKVLTYFPQGYGNNDLNPVRLSADLADARKKATGLTEMLDLYGSGDHGGGATRTVLDEGTGWANAAAQPAPVIPRMQFGTALPFFLKTEKQIAPDSKVWDYTSIAKGYTPPSPVEGKIAIPTWNSELYLEYHRGVQTTQANHKRNMRESEEQVLNAEKWASLAWLDGRPYPGAEITEDWKKILFNQFHDLAAGSGIGIIYKDAQKDYDVVRWSTNEIKAGSLEEVSSRINTATGQKDPEGQAVVVFNPLGWERSGDVTIEARLRQNSGTGALDSGNVAALLDGKGKIIVADVLSRDSATGIARIRFAASDIPALGYEVFRLATTKDKFGAGTGSSKWGSEPKDSGKPESGEYSISTQNLKVSVDAKTGCITSLFDQKAKSEIIAKGGCGNELQAFKDTPKDYDAWNIDPGTLDVPPTLIHDAESVKFVESEPGRSAIRVTRTWQKSKFVQTISLEDGKDYVDIDNEIDWHEQHILLKAAFPVAAESDHATYEIPYGSIERSTKRTNTWEKAQFEVPALRWAELGDGKHGLGLINQTKYGYDAVGNVLRLSLLRSPTSPDPVADQGHHHFRYAIYPHAGTWQESNLVRRAWEYNYPLTATVTTAHPGALPASHSFASVTPENVVLTAVKKAEDANGLIFRVYEFAGKSSTVDFHVPPGATAATVTNMQETPEGQPLTVSGDVVKAPIKPFEILTIRVDYPTKQ
jgi:alpha-mannosidase